MATAAPTTSIGTLRELEKRVTAAIGQKRESRDVNALHAKSMTLGQLALHVAGCNGIIASMGVSDSFAVDPSMMNAPQPSSTEEIVAAFDKGLADAKAMVGKVDDQGMMSDWSMTAGGNPIMTMPKAALYRVLMCSHQYHHRGQLSVYLRLLDIPLPSIYGPSADENPMRA